MRRSVLLLGRVSIEMSEYASLSREELIARLRSLTPSQKSSDYSHLREGKKPFDFSRHPRRKVALRFCYFGWNYSGLTIQEGNTLMPTVESVLFNALAKARLVDPAAGLEGCGWSRCGRTDRGVSAAGQVVSLWVRSNIGFRKANNTLEQATQGNPSVETAGSRDPPVIGSELDGSPYDHAPLQAEIPYVRKLNQILPSTIRILAWSPVSDDFDARFSCKYRHYKYIFTAGSNPCNDIPLMQHAASKFLGEHDFRNFCKLDPTKQITNYKRTMLHSTIEQFRHYSDRDNPREWGNTLLAPPGVYVFNLVGTAFLYHQVRHMMAILFLIGSGLEHPDVIDALLNVGPSAHADQSTSSAVRLPIIETKPVYRIADALPLVLWDCSFDSSDVTWKDDSGDPLPPLPPYNQPPPFTVPPMPTESDSNPPGIPRYGKDSLDLFHNLHKQWTENVIRTSIASLFLQASCTSPRPRRSLSPPPHPSEYTDSSRQPQDGDETDKRGKLPRRRRNYDLGGGETRDEMRYVPLLERERGATVEEINNRRKGRKRG
ncbi:pseudouridine synthase [Cantharellus anzutake]|uniref:pseudouridine synthase n=1 Tax=Cantharellus anzutake TaxID=1750568 RepID=UPI001905A1DF|nr:pseudouridine synthase [Cantharellus anzutake]KAF8326398.1 pseudouridine synthase [Cantharellus anzutake]